MSSEIYNDKEKEGDGSNYFLVFSIKVAAAIVGFAIGLSLSALSFLS